jgi:glycosyltransferase involved in cell wall biosynthesis
MIVGFDASRANKIVKTGTEWYSFFLIQEFRKIFESSNDTLILYTPTPLFGKLAAKSRNVVEKVLRWPPARLWTQCRLTWEALIHPPDVLFVPAHTLPFASRAPMVITIHDVGFVSNPELYSRLEIFYHRWSVRRAVSSAQAIICPSQFTKTELMKYFQCDGSKIHVVHHGRPPGESPADYGSRKDHILYTGRLEKKKNILNILQAFSLFTRQRPGIKLRLAGRPGYGWDEALNLLNKLGLEKRVDVRGYLDEAELRKEYLEAKLFLFPTRYEGFGMPLLEAQLRGCPIVTSDSVVHREVAGEGALYADPEDPADLCKKMEIAWDDHVASELVGKGRVNVLKFDWFTSAEQTMAIISACSKGRLKVQTMV